MRSRSAIVQIEHFFPVVHGESTLFDPFLDGLPFSIAQRKF